MERIEREMNFNDRDLFSETLPILQLLRYCKTARTQSTSLGVKNDVGG